MPKNRDQALAALLARNIRAIRLSRGLTQAELKDRAGWKHQAIISQFETGAAGVGHLTLRKLADALDVSPSIFFMEELPCEYRPEDSGKIGQPTITGSPERKGGKRRPPPIRKVPVFRQEGFKPENFDLKNKIYELPLARPIPGGSRKFVALLLSNPVDADPRVEGEFALVDFSDAALPPEGDKPANWYAVRINDRLLIRLVTRRGDLLRLMTSEGDDNPVVIDLRVISQAILGKVYGFVSQIVRDVA